MFCSKCGAPIEASDLHCPRCGVINPNYVDPKVTPQKSKSKFGIGVKISKIPKISKNSIIRCAAAIVAIGIAVSFKMKIGNSNLFHPDKITYSPNGLYAFYDKDNNVNFISGTDVISLKGPISAGITSPNHANRIARQEDKKLILYNIENEDGIEIASDVEEIDAINDTCVYYSVGKKQHLFLYDFTKKEITDIGFENSDLTFSAKKNAVAAVSSNGELSVFSRNVSEPKVLCNAGTDSSVICVADDGSNLFWSSKSGNTYSIYSMKNGAPERVGKITNSEKYSTVLGYYYDNDQSCIIYSANSTQLILVNNDIVNEIVLPGTKTYEIMVNSNGEYIDSDDDIIHDFYLSVKKNKNNDQCALYRLSKDGSLSIIVDNIENSHYELRNGMVYYVNTDGDLFQKILKEDGYGSKVTTDVDHIYVSPSGEYTYIVKSGGLYYWKTADKGYKLNLISSNFTSDDSVYISGSDDTIFYTSDQKEIAGTYLTHSTLYRYKVGNSAVMVASEVLDVLTNDSKYYDAEHPIIRTYVSNEKYDFVVNYGTISEGTYITLLSDIVY